jgi:hypothetical protein
VERLTKVRAKQARLARTTQFRNVLERYVLGSVFDARAETSIQPWIGGAGGTNTKLRTTLVRGDGVSALSKG